MDPDEALKIARNACKKVVSLHASFEVGTDQAMPAIADEALELAIAFDTLDTWLSKEGFLPKAWERRPVSKVEAPQ